MASSDLQSTPLRREVGLPGAVLLGLGSMVGTGVFVSVGLAAGVAGSSVLLATLLAAALAAANGLSSAQLAAAHPVSGGTYEYGYLLLSPVLGFSAGWMFLLAKSASAATAALGFAGYVIAMAGVEGRGWEVGVSLATVLSVTALVAGGIRRSNRGNAVLVTVSLGGLLLLIAAALPSLLQGPEPLARFAPEPGEGGLGAFLHGSALMFVAFTGYGRIATLGEEVRDPGRTIPRAVGVTVVLVTILYVGVAAVGVGVLGAEGFGRAAEETSAPLEVVASRLGRPGLVWILAVSAVAAMAGVLLNLVLGLSRVLLAMARRGDAPAVMSRVDAARGSPVVAVWACGIIVAAISLVGDVKSTWSFSAFTVLLYYAITNLAALRLPSADRRFPRWVPVVGLAGCLGLAFQVEPLVWFVGLDLLALGLLARAVVNRRPSGGP